MQHLAVPAPIDWQIAEVATRQHGVITRPQLLELGVTARQVALRLSRGQLHRLSESTYAVGHGALGRRGRANAALLQLGAERAAISHHSAARSWRMLEAARTGAMHVSVLDRRDLAVPDGVVLHRPRTLTADDITWRHGLPITTPERTLRDMLRGTSVVEITRMLEQMVTQLNRSPDTLHTWGHNLRGTSGRAKLLMALDHVVGPAVLRSQLEREFRNVCQLGRLPLPQTNVRIGPWEVDALWAHERLVVELDSYRFHGGRWQFDRDRRKGLDLAGRGYEVIRLTWPQVKHEPQMVATTLNLILARRGLD